MKKRYIKMNEKNILSLGNICNCIKEVSCGKSAMQKEIFCVLFNTNDINNTTVNNYIIGIRAIGVLYKKVYIDLYNKYKEDKNIFCDIVINIISLLDEKIYNINENKIDFINNNYNFNNLCIKILDICNKDNSLSEDFVNKLNNFVKHNNLYDMFVLVLYHSIVINKQPIFVNDVNVSFNKKELEDYMKVKLYEGVSFISSLILLSKNKNMYACAELGSLAYDGLINGNADYNMAYKYYLIAADKGHPKACYMIANLIYKGFVKENVNIMWKYLNKGIKLGSNAAINLKGLCYLKGVNPKNIINKNKAIEYFNEASKNGYAFAYNNLGYIYEKDNDMNKAIEYYKISADLGNSWALNKMGEYYRNKGDMETAYLYYTMSNDAPINERCKWAKYNLEKYF